MDVTIPPEPVRFAASDGWQLEGEVHVGPNPTVAILISGGTGFTRKFYRDFARDMAARGAVVLTYDYRGTGGSREGADWFGIDYPDWGHLDLPAAIDALEARAPGLPIVHVGHSIGGQLVGLAHNHRKIARHAFIGVGSGYLWKGWNKNLPREFVFWWIIGVYSLARYGYMARIGGWRGAELPPKLFRSWRRWCNRSRHFAPELDGIMSPHHFAEVETPIQSWILTDDTIATPKTGRYILSFYKNAPHEMQIVAPQDIGAAKIGHDGAVRSGGAALWDGFWAWLANGERPKKI